MSTSELPEESESVLVELEAEAEYTRVRVRTGAFLRKVGKEFVEKTDGLLEAGRPRLLVDFRDCEYISSEGLGCVAELWRKCHDEGRGTMVVLFQSRSDNELYYLFDIIGLTRLMEGHVFTEDAKARRFLASQSDS